MEAGAGSRKKYPSQVPRVGQAKLNDFLLQQCLTGSVRSHTTAQLQAAERRTPVRSHTWIFRVKTEELNQATQKHQHFTSIYIYTL